MVATERIRNVALVGHNGNGKTSLAEVLLYRAGVLQRPGEIENVLDLTTCVGIAAELGIGAADQPMNADQGEIQATLIAHDLGSGNSPITSLPNGDPRHTGVAKVCAGIADVDCTGAALVHSA